MSGIIHFMKEFNYNPKKPIIVGLSGKAVTGKTSVAEAIVPKASIVNESSGILWDHIFFALPLYELANIRNQIRGSRQQTRQLYAIHETLYDVFGGSPIGDIPSYEELFALVKSIHDLPIEPEGVKPRSFLQKAGDLCRSHKSDCFAQWGINKVKKIYSEYISSLNEDADPSPFGVIISDVRFINEAEAIRSQENSILVCYTASDEARNQRMMNRDGRLMTEEQMNHPSELQIDDIATISDLVMDTTDMSIEEQKGLTSEFVASMVGVYA